MKGAKIEKCIAIRDLNIAGQPEIFGVLAGQFPPLL